MLNIGVTPGLGLCNRLKMLFSHYIHMQVTGTIMEMYWVPSWACDGVFLDYFKPLENVTFIQEKNQSAIINYNKYHPEYIEHRNLFKDLYLNEQMKKEMEDLWNRIGSPSEVVAIHVRRTDHIELAKKNDNYTHDEEFFEFVENYPNKKIYLATDNNETQEMFINKYGKDRIVYNVKIATSESIRQTSVKDAIIDLFACAQAFNFMGSGYSSFSGVIEKLVNK